MNEQASSYSPFKDSPELCVKLYNDKVTLSRYKKPVAKFKQLDAWHKVYLPTGEICTHTYNDSRRYVKNHRVSVNRALKKIKEIGKKNVFAYFLTITFKKEYVRRDSAKDVYRVYKNVMKRLKYHYGEIEYLAVPEFHADEKNIHVHLQISFERKPKIHRYARYHGRDLFYITDKFKRDDCRLELEKLNGVNATYYCIKYMTKDSVSPFPRRYLASRNLNRSRLQANVQLAYDSYNVRSIARQAGFLSVFNSNGLYHMTYVSENETQTDSDAQARAGARLHLSTINTMDENVERKFWEFLETLTNSAAMRDKIREIRKKAAELREKAKNDKKAVWQQLAFTLEI